MVPTSKLKGGSQLAIAAVLIVVMGSWTMGSWGEASASGSGASGNSDLGRGSAACDLTAGQARAPWPVKVAVFPPYIPGSSANGNASEYIDGLMDVIAEAAPPESDVIIDFDYRRNYRGKRKALPRARELWTGRSYSGRPDVPAVLDAAAPLGADYVLMLRLKMSPVRDDDGQDDGGTFILHVIDVASGTSAQVNGDARAPKPVVDEAVAGIRRHRAACLEHFGRRAAAS